MSVAAVVLWLYRRIRAVTSTLRAEQFSSVRGLFCFSCAVRKCIKRERLRFKIHLLKVLPKGMLLFTSL